MEYVRYSWVICLWAPFWSTLFEMVSYESGVFPMSDSFLVADVFSLLSFGILDTDNVFSTKRETRVEIESLIHSQMYIWDTSYKDPMASFVTRADVPQVH